MRLLELEISNIRGIKNCALKPDGESFVVWGPNGSGKSAVVDAIDFLFTGKISRLIGEGTGGISLKAHGPHVDHDAAESFVKGVVRISGYANPITLRRGIASATDLEIAPGAEDALRPILGIAAKGQLVLSRRQILRFIAAEPSKRASEVQALLDLNELEEIRKTLTRAENTAKVESSQADNGLRSAQLTLGMTVGLDQFSETAALEKINAFRKTLSGEPVNTLQASLIKFNLTAITITKETQGVNPQLLRQDSDELKKMLEKENETIKQPETDLRQFLRELNSDATSVKASKRLKLLELGISSIDDSGACPLCETKWPKGELAKHLREHIDAAKVVAQKITVVDGLASTLTDHLRKTLNILSRSLAAADKLEMNDASSKLRSLVSVTDKLIRALNMPVESYPENPDKGPIAEILALGDTMILIESIASEAAKRLPPLTPEQSAWDALTRIEENLKVCSTAQQKKEQAAKSFRIAQLVSNHFEQARDAILSSLYKSIEARFTELYRAVHSEDEAEFESELLPDGAGLNLKVDFHRRGKFPPLAVHSEGHQDTMGFCLYLALAEKLNAGLIDLIVLDDVVMSVDSGHRRQICKVLKEKFADKQFAITTHDKTWARELEVTGVVGRANGFEFSNWTIDSGPMVADADLWSQIAEDLKREDVPTAAHRLRRGAEQFFEFACDSLRAKLVYKSTGRYELSDFANGAVSAYNKLLRSAKASAQSWQKKTDFDKLTELETVVRQIIDRSNVERWAVNENVHYNRWIEFSKQDLTPVVEAFRDLFALFQCRSCNATLFVQLDKKLQPTTLRCNCGTVNWNLIAK